jgi:hypothetical protein
MKVDKTKKIIDLLRKMSANGDMTWISASNGVPEVVKKRDLDEFLTAFKAMAERKQEVFSGR